LAELRAAGAPSFFVRETSELVAKFKAKYEADTKKTLFDGQPEMFLIELLAYVISVFGEGGQNAVLQNTVAWSTGRHVEDRGTNVSIFRLMPQAARTTLQFTLENAKATATTISTGFSVSSSGVSFRTDKDLIIPAGSLSGEVIATASDFGSQFNGFAIGSINAAVDDLPVGVSVQNITPSAGGSEIEELERFRQRVANGLFLISKAGPKPGYRELAMGAHPDIVDVGVIRPEPGDIALYVLMRDGSEPPEILNAVEAVFDPELPARPMGDDVFFHFAEAVLFAPVISAKTSQAVAGIENNIRAIVTALFDEWRIETGVQVSASEIIKRIKKLAFVVDVTVSNMGFTDLGENQYPKLDLDAFALEASVIVEVAPNV
jgi:phage-related baseplate assembly protein